MAQNPQAQAVDPQKANYDKEVDKKFPADKQGGKFKQKNVIMKQLYTFGYQNFKKYLTHAFNSYDDDASGSLDPEELRDFINELRTFLNL